MIAADLTAPGQVKVLHMIADNYYWTTHDAPGKGNAARKHIQIERTCKYVSRLGQLSIQMCKFFQAKSFISEVLKQIQ